MLKKILVRGDIISVKVGDYANARLVEGDRMNIRKSKLGGVLKKNLMEKCWQ